MLTEKALEIIGAEILENRNGIFSAFRGVGHLLFNGRQRVLIAGSSGTGKSTLGTLLGMPPKKEMPRKVGAYLPSLSMEEHKLPGLILGRVHALPGNSLFHAATLRTWTPFLEKLSENKYQGVIHVVCGGFHSPPTGVRLTNLYSQHKFASRKELIDFHVRNCIDREIDLIKELGSALKERKRPGWLLTLVTKQDLWAENETTILQLYNSGRYQTCIEDIQRNARAPITHNVVPISLNLVNLSDGDGVVQKTEPGFDQGQSLRSIRIFLGQFAQLVKLTKTPEE